MSSDDMPQINPRNHVNPKFTNLGYSLRRYFVDEFHFRHVPMLPGGSTVLDLGGHKNCKRGQFDITEYDLQVTYMNLYTAKGTDIQADVAYIPCLNNYFDAVICSELLEHIFQPLIVLREAYRALRPNGILLVCVPFLYHIHGDPLDFGRYTDYFWQAGLSDIGFDEILIEPQGLFFSVMVDFCKNYLNQLEIPKPLGRIIRYFVARLMLPPQYLALRYERRSIVQANPTLRSYTTGFGIRAVKP
jgi:SAM-dependent methyltransferase